MSFESESRVNPNTVTCLQDILGHVAGKELTPIGTVDIDALATTVTNTSGEGESAVSCAVKDCARMCIINFGIDRIDIVPGSEQGTCVRND